MNIPKNCLLIIISATSNPHTQTEIVMTKNASLIKDPNVSEMLQCFYCKVNVQQNNLL